MAISQPLSVSELLLLNEELRLALRSGVPLDLGLQDSAGHLPRRLALLAEQLATHVSEGQSLPAALDRLNPPPPVIYRVLVAAGLRGDQLERVLTQLDEFGRVLIEMRETLRRAMIYPLSVLVVGYAVACLTIRYGVPPLRDFLVDLRSEPSPPIRAMYWLNENFAACAIGLPVAFLLLMGTGVLFDWLQSGRLGSLGLLRFVPGLGTVRKNFELSQLAHLLSIQVEHGVPLPESLRRCAEFAGAGPLRRDCEMAAQQVEAGAPITEFRSAPPFLQWILTVPVSQSELVANSRQAAELYRDRTALQAEWIARVVPAVLTLGLGTLIVGGYCWVVMDSLAVLWLRVLHE